MQFEDHELKSNARAFASRSKAKAKPQRRTSASSSKKTRAIGERNWTDIEPQDSSPTDYSVSRKLITLLRHGSLPREDDGAIEFWRFKDYLRNHVDQSQHWSDEMWKSTMARGGGNRKIFQHCTDPSGQEILHLRALQGHSGRNIRQCCDSEQFLPACLPYWMCVQSSFYHQQWIDTWRSKFKQETDSILFAH